MNKRLTRWTPAAILLIAGSTQSLAAGPFGAAFELSSLNGTNGFVLNGIDATDFSGHSVSSAGDINDDGVSDLVISGHLGDPNGVLGAGECYVVFGGVGLGASGTMDLSSLNGANGFVINGIDIRDYTGVSVSSAGDINGDGIDDLIIGARYADPHGAESGESYIIFGGNSVGASGSLNLSDLNGANGFIIEGISNGYHSGSSVSSAGDINGDGAVDLIIGARWANPNGMNSGECYVVFGGAGVGSGGVVPLSTLNGANGFMLHGIDVLDNCGASVSSAGDINGDGVADLVVGAPFADGNGAYYAGESYVVFGATDVGASGVIEMDSLTGTNGFTIDGVNNDDKSGTSVASAGDVNGDGIDDLIIGAYTFHAVYPFPPLIGKSYLIFGNNSIGSGGSLDLASLNGPNGFVCNGVDPIDFTGWAVSSAGDLNNDGVSDVIIGAPQADPNGSASGESYVVFGGAGLGAIGTLDLASLSGTDGFVINGVNASDQSGYSVSSAGDVNGDGVDDVIIGAIGGDPNGQSRAGASYVIFGSCAIPADLNSDGIVDTADLGTLIAQFGTPGPDADINGDGSVDTADLGILISAFGIPCP